MHYQFRHAPTTHLLYISLLFISDCLMSSSLIPPGILFPALGLSLCISTRLLALTLDSIAPLLSFRYHPLQVRGLYCRDICHIWVVFDDLLGTLLTCRNLFIYESVLFKTIGYYIGSVEVLIVVVCRIDIKSTSP